MEQSYKPNDPSGMCPPGEDCNAIQEFFAPIGNFFSGLWNSAVDHAKVTVGAAPPEEHPAYKAAVSTVETIDAIASDPEGALANAGVNALNFAADYISGDPSAQGEMAVFALTMLTPGPLDDVAAGTRAASKVDELVGPIGQGDGVIYLRVDDAGVIDKPYAGQAGSMQRYLQRQKEHARANPNSDFSFSIVDRGNTMGPHPTDLSRKEQNFLDYLGGPTNKSNPNGGASNKKNVIRKK